MTFLEQLVRRWKKQRSFVLPPAPSIDVVAAFQSAGQLASADVIALYGKCGGMEQMDNNYWRLWPLCKVATDNAVASEFGALFGDFLIESWCYRIRPLSAEVSVVYVDYFDGNEPKRVASSVEEFIASLWRDPQEVLERQLAGADSSGP